MNKIHKYDICIDMQTFINEHVSSPPFIMKFMNEAEMMLASFSLLHTSHHLSQHLGSISAYLAETIMPNGIICWLDLYTKAFMNEIYGHHQWINGDPPLVVVANLAR